MDWKRYDKAIFRCLNEIEIVHAQRTAHMALRQIVPNSKSIFSGFPGLVNAAFNTSTQNGLALVLETHAPKSRPCFWWLHRTSLKMVPDYDPKQGDIKFLEEFSTKLKKLRNETLFHISIESLEDPNQLRRDIGLSYDEMDKAISYTLFILREILGLRRGASTWSLGTKNVSSLDYDASDIGRLFT